jgi:hypothetical protein
MSASEIMALSARQRKRRKKRRRDQKHVKATVNPRPPTRAPSRTMRWLESRTNKGMCLLTERACVLGEVYLPAREPDGEPTRGLGLFSTRFVRPEHVFTEYGGETVDEKTAKERGPSHHCSLCDGTGRVIIGIRDPARVPFYPLSTLGSFVNSCNKLDDGDRDRVNCYLQTCTSESTPPRVFVVSRRDIQPGEELVIDYGTLALDAHHLNK